MSTCQRQTRKSNFHIIQQLVLNQVTYMCRRAVLLKDLPATMIFIHGFTTHVKMR